MKKGSPGFTLVEMIVTIAAMSIVCAAATIIMITSFRTNRMLTDSSQKQMGIELISEAIENISGFSGIATPGNSSITLDGKDYISKTPMNDGSGNPRIIEGQQMYDLNLNGASVVRDVVSFAPSLDETDHILSYTIEVLQNGKIEQYTCSVYCPCS